MFFANPNTPRMIIISLGIFYVFILFLVLLGERRTTWKAFRALIIKGRYKGQYGLVVNSPNVFNLFGIICCISLPVTEEEVSKDLWEKQKIDLVDLMNNGFVPKKFVYVFRWQLRTKT